MYSMFKVVLLIAAAIFICACDGQNSSNEKADQSAISPETSSPETAERSAIQSQPARLTVTELAALLEFCRVPDPGVPSSAFLISKSEIASYDDYWQDDYWMNYRCKEPCPDWQQCTVPAYSWDHGEIMYHGRRPDVPKTALAFVVDGMGGHLAYTTDGDDNTVFLHVGGGGSAYDQEMALKMEQNSPANTVLVRWEPGFTHNYDDGIPYPPYLNGWGWFTRTSPEATSVSQLNRRVAGVIAWSHENLAGPSGFNTMGCSMGTVATFGPVLWYGLDDIIDYQLFVGGPPLYDVDASCGTHTYTQGYCDLDVNVACRNDADCQDDSATGSCRVPTTVSASWVFESIINHVHATSECRAAEPDNEPYPPFQDSGMKHARQGDWDIDHSVDFIVDVGGAFDPWNSDGGDEHWNLGHFMPVYHKLNMALGSEKKWYAYTGTNHCDAFYGSSDRAAEIAVAGMKLDKP